LAATLRPGDVQSANHWEERLLSEFERQQKDGKEVVVAGAAFTKPANENRNGTSPDCCRVGWEGPVQSLGRA
jgi:hypothetical protein